MKRTSHTEAPEKLTEPYPDMPGLQAFIDKCEAEALAEANEQEAALYALLNSSKRGRLLKDELERAMKASGVSDESLLRILKRQDEAKHAKKRKRRYREPPQAGGPARRSAGRNYGTIGARYFGACQRIEHFRDAMLRAKHARRPAGAAA